MLLTGAQVLMECLREQGVEVVFGYPGGTILNVYDALLGYPEITHYLTSHEQGAAHAADGYARSTGKVGVCFATSGPGCANLTTGIATAYMDSSPVVFVTCNVAERQLGKDSFQEVDITGITMPITKWNYMVRHATCLADVIREAFAIARSGRPGPVLIDIANNATIEKTDYEYVPRELHHTRGRLKRLLERRSSLDDLKPPEPNPDDIDTLVEMIEASERPLLMCGGGVVRGRAHQEFRALAEKIDVPVAITLMGAGGFCGADPLATGLIGMHGSRASNQAVDACDLLIAVGCRFSDRVALNPETFAQQAKIVQIDIDRAEVNKNVIVDHHVIGDAAQVLSLLCDKMQPMNHASWKEYVFSFPTDDDYGDVGDAFTPKAIADVMKRLCPKDAMVTTDVGQHQMWAAQLMHFHYPGQLITSGGFGAMGFGLGAAIGAKVGNPEKTVIHITGDGSFRMNSNELATEEH
ncbi:MAG: acetolactate synthase large subunit, partial [Eggerthellaceae bacterium]|nr:acetolactate synthase large subunit [Eggerthellaceae bacterium]